MYSSKHKGKKGKFTIKAVFSLAIMEIIKDLENILEKYFSPINIFNLP